MTTPSVDETPARIRRLPTWTLSRAHARAHRMLTERFAQAGVRGYDYRILAALDEFGPASQASLSRRTGIDRSDVVACLNDLAAQGFVKRSPDPDDGRRNVIHLSKAGTRKLVGLDAAVAEVQEQVLAPLTKVERKQLLSLLAKLSDSP